MMFRFNIFLLFVRERELVEAFKKYRNFLDVYMMNISHDWYLEISSRKDLHENNIIAFLCVPIDFIAMFNGLLHTLQDNEFHFLNYPINNLEIFKLYYHICCLNSCKHVPFHAFKNWNIYLSQGRPGMTSCIYIYVNMYIYVYVYMYIYKYVYM